MEKIIIYHKKVPAMGGIETAIFNLIKAFAGEYHFIILFEEANSSLMIKWSDYADVKKYEGEEIQSYICINASNHILPESIKAKRYFQWIHADFERYKLKMVTDIRIEKYICVSEHVRKVTQRILNDGGIACEVVTIPNLIDESFKEKAKPPLRLITNARISTEKGFPRMLKLAEKLQENGVDFTWDVFGTTSWTYYFTEVKKSFAHLPQVVFRGMVDDVKPYLSQADYLVQLSDHEGFCYSVAEALTMGVPCIVTDLETLRELVDDGKNGYILSMDMQNIPIKKIVQHIPNNFIFYPKGEKALWEKYIFSK